MKQLSTLLSWLFHPLTMVTWCTFIYLFLVPLNYTFMSADVPYRILGLLAIATVLLPAMLVLLMLRTGIVGTVEMDRQRERNWPLLQCAVVYVGAYYAIHFKGLPAFIQLFLFGAIIGIVLSLLINLRWKISLHMIGAGGLCGGIAALLMVNDMASPMILAGCFVLSGLLGTARLYLRSHSPVQVLAGFAIGFAVEFLLIFLR